MSRQCSIYVFFCVCKLHVHIAIYRYQVAFVLHSPLKFHHYWLPCQSIEERFGIKGQTHCDDGQMLQVTSPRPCCCRPSWLEHLQQGRNRGAPRENRFHLYYYTINICLLSCISSMMQSNIKSSCFWSWCPKKICRILSIKTQQPQICGSFTLQRNSVKGDCILDIVWRVLFLNVLKDPYKVVSPWDTETVPQPSLRICEINDPLLLQNKHFIYRHSVELQKKKN